MPEPIKIRAANADGFTVVRLQASHVMETGRREDEAGRVVPAWFITELRVMYQDRLVLAGDFGTSVAKNPYLVFKFRGGKAGDRIAVTWTDNKGETRTDQAVIA